MVHVMELKDLSPRKDPKGGGTLMTDPEDRPRGVINLNTGMSIGIIVIVCGGMVTILSAINSSRTEISATRQELNGRFDQMELRVKSLESAKNSWTGVDMFKWSVHLQQLNNDPKKLQTEGLKVPEPEVNTK